MRKEHELKSWEEFFQDVVDDIKTFEIRKNDRKFKVGDLLVLREFVPCAQCGATGRMWDNGDRCECNKCNNDYGVYTGRTWEGHITYITSFAQRDDYVVMAIKPNE